MTLHLIDLGNVLAILAGSMTGVLAFFQWLRVLFLDRITQSMDDGARDALYHGLVWLILSGLILGLALLTGYPFSVMLVISAGVVAVPIAGAVHFVYQKLQKSSTSALLASVASTTPLTAPSPLAPLPPMAVTSVASDADAPILVQPED